MNIFKEKVQKVKKEVLKNLDKIKNLAKVFQKPVAPGLKKLLFFEVKLL